MVGKKLKALGAMLLCGVMLVSFSGCADTTWTLEINEKKIPIGVYLTYLTGACYDATSQVTDSTKDVFDQKIEDKDAAQWMIDTAITESRAYAWVDKVWTDKKYSLTLQEQSNIDTQVDSAWSTYESIYSENGVSKDSYKLVTQNSYMSSIIFKKMYMPGGEKAVSDADLSKYVKDTYYRVKPMIFLKTDSSGAALTGDALTQAKETATSYYNKANKGEDMDKLIEAYNKEQGATDSTSTSTTYKNEQMRLKTNLSDANKESVEKLGNGKVIMVEEDQAFLVMQKLDISARNDYIKDDDVRASYLSAMKGEEYTEYVKTEAGKLPLEQNNGAIK